MKILERQSLHRPRRRPTRRGFTVVMVLAVMMLMGGAVIGISILLQHEMARTRAAVAQTQLRQLLLASVPLAEAQLPSAGATPPAAPERDVVVPVPVEGATLMLHVRPPLVWTDGPGNNYSGITIVVTAEYQHVKATQTLVFTHAGTAWTLTDSRLGPERESQ